MSRSLALFDFDGTLTHKDSLFVFLRFVLGPVKFWMSMGILIPIFILLAIHVISNSKAKALVLTLCLGGRRIKDLKPIATRFASDKIPQILNQTMLSRLKGHQANGDRVVIVSASADLWLKDWCTQEGIADLLATQLEVVNGVLTGNLASANCRGPEKVRRIQELLDIRDYERIFAYGDSSGDQEMLALAHEAWYRGKRIR